jgi:hypothetical protein
VRQEVSGQNVRLPNRRETKDGTAGRIGKQYEAEKMAQETTGANQYTKEQTGQNVRSATTREVKMEEIPMETIHTGASHDVKVFYGYPGKSFFSRSLMTGEYTIYISVDSADPGAVIDLALEYIRSHQKEVAV